MGEPGTARIEWVRARDAREARRTAAECFAQAAQHASRAGRYGPRLAVAGGSAAAALGDARVMLGRVWSNVRLTWVDERCVPFNDEASNRGGAYRYGYLSREGPVAHELPLYLDGEVPEASIARVTRALRDRFDDGLDATLLGLGEDGHIASLFPGHAVLQLPVDVRVAHEPASPKAPPSRMTLTLGMLRTASVHVLLATGEAKRAALMRLKAADRTLPAYGLAGLVIVTDVDLGTGA